MANGQFTKLPFAYIIILYVLYLTSRGHPIYRPRGYLYIFLFALVCQPGTLFSWFWKFQTQISSAWQKSSEQLRMENLRSFSLFPFLSSSHVLCLSSVQAMHNKTCWILIGKSPLHFNAQHPNRRTTKNVGFWLG